MQKVGRLSLAVFCFVGVARADVKRVCDTGLLDHHARNVVVTLYGKETTEKPTRISLALKADETKDVGPAERYDLIKVADYMKGAAFRFQFNEKLDGVVDYFGGRGSLYVNFPTEFTHYFDVSKHCKPEQKE